MQDPYTNYTQQTALGKRPFGQPDMTPSARPQGLEPMYNPGVNQPLPNAGIPSMSGVQPGMVLADPFLQPGIQPGRQVGLQPGLQSGMQPGIMQPGTQPGLIAGDAGLPIGATGTGLQSQGLVSQRPGAGTVTFRPLEGRFNKDKDPIGKMDPYCKFKIGWHRAKSSVAQGQGVNPTWGDVITLERKHGEQFAKLKVKDRDRFTFNDRLGEVKINLDEIAMKGKVQQWYTLTKRDKVTGEILLDIEYLPRNVL